MDGQVRYEVEDRVAVVTIDRAAKKNAMSMDVFDGLRAAGERAAEESTDGGPVGAVLVRGADGVFSAGIDLATFGGELAEGPTPSFIAGLQQSFTVFEDLDVPSVAFVDGYCFGAGLQLAAACHVRLVTPRAQLSLMEARWGLVPDLGGTYRLGRLVGPGRTTELALTARRVPGVEAVSMGLCEVLVEEDDAEAAAFAWVRRLAHGPGALRRVPRLVRENLDRDRTAALAAEAEAQLGAMAGPDFGEALAAGIEQREPRFVGR